MDGELGLERFQANPYGKSRLEMLQAESKWEMWD